MQYRILIGIALFSCGVFAQENPVDLVNPFIGTSNYGTTNPGPIAMRGMVSVSPFNVAGPVPYLDLSQYLERLQR